MPTTPRSFSQVPRLSAPSADTARARRKRAVIGKLTLPDLRDAVDAELIDTVFYALPNSQGQLKGKRYGARHFLDKVALDGADMCAYLLATDVEMSPRHGFDLTSWDSGFEDTGVVPDLATLRLVPWMPRTVLVLGDAVDAADAPVEVAPGRSCAPSSPGSPHTACTPRSAWRPSSCSTKAPTPPPPASGPADSFRQRT